MKTFLYKIFFIILLFNLVSSAMEKKERVLLIGIDGLLKKCMNVDNLSILKFMEHNGSYTYFARTAIEAFSAPGWSNILCGMDTESSGVVDNGWKAPWFYKIPQKITPISGNDQPLPCIFEQIKKENKNLKTAAYFSWDWFDNLSNKTIPGSIDVQEMCDMKDMETSIQCDIKSVGRVKEMISNDFDFLFWYIGSVDETGHAKSFCSDTYIDRISAVNKHMSDIFDHLKKENIFENTYIMITSDHGATNLSHFHGDQTDDNLLVPWWIIGPKVKSGYEIKAKIKNADTSPTIIKILNLSPNEFWRSKSVNEVFIQNEDHLKFLD